MRDWSGNGGGSGMSDILREGALGAMVWPRVCAQNNGWGSSGGYRTGGGGTGGGGGQMSSRLVADTSVGPGEKWSRACMGRWTIRLGG